MNLLVIYLLLSSFLALTINCLGSTGHGSLLFDNTAGEKLQYMINKFMNWREIEKNRLKVGNLGPGDVTSINLTMIYGGDQVNVIPTELSAVFDIRLATEVDTNKMKETILEWCHNAGPNVNVTFKDNAVRCKPTKLDNSNLWWVAFKEECDKMYVKL